MHVTVNGVRLFVEVLGPKLVPDGPRMIERPTVVALHGGPSDHAHMRGMVERLTDVAQVVVYDHRGCGRSEPGDPALWTLDQWGDDVRGVCDALGIEAPIVLGLSFGGFVAQAYATRHPGHASRLVLAVTGPRYDIDLATEGFRRQGERDGPGRGETAAQAYAAFAARPDRETIMGFVAACRTLYTTGRTLDADLEARTRTNLPLTLDFFARVAPAFDFTEALAVVETPTLILGGDEDPITPPGCQDALERALTRAPVRRVRFANAGHMIAQDATEAVAAELRAWVAG